MSARFLGAICGPTQALAVLVGTGAGPIRYDTNNLLHTECHLAYKTTTNTGTATLAERIESERTLHRLYTTYMTKRTGNNNHTYTACNPRLGYSCIPPACAQTDTVPKAVLHNHSSPTIALPAKMGPWPQISTTPPATTTPPPAPASPRHAERAGPGY